MYKEGTKLKLRFTTSYGVLGIEQLWDLSLTALDNLAVELKKQYKESSKESFLVKKSKKDRIAKLKFDIVLDILTTKVNEADTLKEQTEAKAFNEKIMSLIAEKEDDNLKSKSVNELKKMLRK